MLRVLDEIVGSTADEAVAQRLHELAHRDKAVEYLHVDADDLDRRRLRVTSDAGREYAVVLPRDSVLADGAVLVLEADHAVVVRAGAPNFLTFRPTDLAAALRLGYVAGHLHWQISQHDDALVVRLEGQESDYTARIADLLADGRVRSVSGRPDD